MGNQKYSPADRKAVRLDSRKLRSTLASLFNRSSSRYALLFLPLLPVVVAVSQLLLPACNRIRAAEVAQEVKNEFGGKEVGAFTVLKSIRLHGLSWCYFTGDDGQPLPVTRSFTPPIHDFHNVDREITVDDTRYYEAVTPLARGVSLHVGVSLVSGGQNSLALIAALVGYLMSVLVVEAAVVQPVLRAGRRLADKQQSGCLDVKELQAQRDDLVVPAESSRLLDRIHAWFLADDQRQRTEEAKRESDLKRWKQMTNAEASGGNQSPQSALPSAAAQPVEATLDKWLYSQTSSAAFIQQFLQQLRADMPAALEHIVFLTNNDKGELAIVHHFGVADNWIEGLQRFAQRRLSSSRAESVLDIGTLSMRRVGQELMLGSDPVRRAVFVPINYQSRTLGWIGTFLRTEDLLTADDVSMIKRMTDKISAFLFRLVLREESEREQWTDRLTGLRNRSFLENLLTNLSITQANDESGKEFALIFLVMEPQEGSFVGIPLDAQDSCIHHTARLIQQAVAKHPMRNCEINAVRYQQQVFALVLSPAPADEPEKLVRNLEQNFAELKANVPTLSHMNLFAGAARCPADARSVDDLISAAQSAVDYASDSDLRLVLAKHVPAGFVATKRTSLDGELGVFDAAALLLSITGSQKTGLLTVEPAQGVTFQGVFDGGYLTHAQFAGFVGVDAVTEFVVVCKTGHFQFRQMPGNQSYPTSAATPSLERCLMEAALCQDKYNIGRKILKSADNILVAVGDENARQNVYENADITPQERDAMISMFRLIDGRSSLRVLWQNLPAGTMTSHMKWYAGQKRRIIQSRESR